MNFREMEHSRVAILGAGREGRAVWRQFRRRYPNKPLSLFSESAVEEEFLQQLNPAIDTLHIGPLDVAKLRPFDWLVRSAGISVYRDELVRLRSEGRRFTTATNLWFAANPGAKTICISGTMGKSTTAALIAHLLSWAGIKVCLAGNIGRPMLDCEGENPDWWVIELSSYQISDLEAKPDVAVLLNISEEHLDWHQGIEHYKADKLKLVQLACGGRIIANYSDHVLSESLENHPGIGWFNKIGTWQAGKTSVFRQFDETAEQQGSGYGLSTISQSHVAAPVTLPGEHNMQNLAAALSVVDTLGLDVPRLDEALLSFSGLPYRLQTLGERAGIRYINDSISTTPVSVSAALETVGHKDVVLLLGGMDRGLDWSGFARDVLDRTPYAIITLPDNGQKIFDCLKAAGVEPEGDLHASAGLREAVNLAQKLVPESGCVLLSPGAPSFPHFRDYEDRGEQFRKLAGF